RGTQSCGPPLRRPCAGLGAYAALPRSLPQLAPRPPEDLARALPCPQIIAAGTAAGAEVPVVVIDAAGGRRRIVAIDRDSAYRERPSRAARRGTAAPTAARA